VEDEIGMGNSHELKQQHERAVATDFCALYNSHFQRSLSVERSGTPPEPDVVCIDANAPSDLLGIEVTTTYLGEGQAVETVGDVPGPNAQAKSGQPMSDAKWTWDIERGNNSPPIWISDELNEPTTMELQKLEGAITSKSNKTYNGCACYFLVIDWQYFGVNLNLLEDVKSHFSSNDMGNPPFDEIWITCRLGSELGRQAIVKLFPSVDGPYLGPEVVL
jgi:hypothetical protein